MRHLRPEDIYDAASWYTGCDLRKDHPQYTRTVKARTIYWAALRELGMGYTEMSRFTGFDASRISHALRRNPPEIEDVRAVVNRAIEMVQKESLMEVE